MTRQRRLWLLPSLLFFASFIGNITAQELPPRYPMLELFTNTPCPICGSQNPGMFERLTNYEGQYHLVSFYPGTPYVSCIFYQANIPENSARLAFYPQIFGTPRVAINGLQFMSSGSVSNTVLDNITGTTSWLSVQVAETSGSTRDVVILLQDHAGGSLDTGKLFAVIVEREIMYNAPNGETVHHNVFRKFLSDVNGDVIDMSSGLASMEYSYDVEAGWQEDEVYVMAWLMDPETKEILNSGTRFDPVLSGTRTIETHALRIFPNPASGLVHIEVPDHIQDPVRIFNTSGQLVRQILPASAPEVIIDVSDWPAGMYRAEIKSNNKVWSAGIEVLQ